jgi:hypothetical protein
MPTRLLSVSDAGTEALHALNILDTPREERFDRIVRAARDIFKVPMAAVNLMDTDRQWTKAKAGLPGPDDTPLDEVICPHAVRQGSLLVVPDASTDERFRDIPAVASKPHIRFYAGQPLKAPGGEPVGSLCILDTEPRELDDREARVLADMGAWVERELSLQRELDQAAEVQRVLLPHTIPHLPGYELAARCVPSAAIGGDFYTWQELPDGRLQLQVADVMGHGIPAALIAASVRAMLSGAARYNGQTDTIHRAAAAAEQLLADTGSFVTLFSARLDPATGCLEYVDAGHGLAFVFREGEGYRRLSQSGPPLGILPDQHWDVHRTVLEPGETLVIVSDGFLDFFPTLQETLDQALAAGLAALPPADLVDRAISFTNAGGQQDDVTVVALRRTGDRKTSDG